MTRKLSADSFRAKVGLFFPRRNQILVVNLQHRNLQTSNHYLKATRYEKFKLQKRLSWSTR